jgi:transposase-like protein
MVVVDQFTKYSYFISSSYPYTVINVAHFFLKNIYKYHGIPTFIITDRDPIFTNNFEKKNTQIVRFQIEYVINLQP